MNWTHWLYIAVFALNLVGLALYHYTWKKDEKGEWKNSKEFWFFTVWIILFGTAYLALRGILWLKNLFKK